MGENPASAGAFGARVRQARVGAGLTQDDVIEGMLQLGYDEKQNWISRIELGHTKRIDFDKLVALARVIRDDAYYLLTGDRRDEQDTRFLAQMRQYERDLDERGIETVVRVAEEQVALARAERERRLRAVSNGVERYLAQVDPEWHDVILNTPPENRDQVLAAIRAAQRRMTEADDRPASQDQRGEDDQPPRRRGRARR